MSDGPATDEIESEAPEVSSDEVLTAEEPTEHQPYGCPESITLGERVIHPARAQWQQTAQILLNDGWNMCIDLTAVDYLTYAVPRNLPDGVVAQRFEVVAGFISHSTGQRIRARVQVPGSDPTVGSLTSIYPGTDYLEREVFDMFGITFEGHPDLSRILMPETWEGHPLRKDYDVGAIPVQFKGPQGG